MNGRLCPGADGGLHLFLGDRHFLVAAEDVRPLLSSGRTVPVTTVEVTSEADGDMSGQVMIVGHAAMNVFERAVTVFTVAGHFIVPLVSVQRVVRGEAASAPLFPLIPEGCP
ncbi:hypothetical protein [Methanofollis sp. W23]|uniref:hypothetical protein n=1 Tax=Methanofollis sp. W23 TaxID=2817849 RepID=UPI001AE7F499|nr:hypothetical protein [Methanofollis sp. W23]